MTLPKNVNNDIVEANATAWVAAFYFLYTLAARRAEAAAAQDAAAAAQASGLPVINAVANGSVNIFAALPANTALT